MDRVYLEEDIRLVQKYFPGAKSVALHTPFDLTPRGGNHSQPLISDTFRDDEPNGRWYGDLLWSR